MRIVLAFGIVDIMRCNVLLLELRLLSLVDLPYQGPPHFEAIELWLGGLERSRGVLGAAVLQE